MTPRKPPYRHPVRRHTRAGVPVKRYKRGKGQKPRQNNPGHGPSADYSVAVGYPGKPGETVNVKASTYTGAVREALKRITVPAVPNRVKVTRL